MLLPRVRFGHGAALLQYHMPMTCPSAGELTFAAIGLGLVVVLIAGVIGHGVLRPLLEARGVTPWTVRDSIGSMPLVLLGSGLMGACSAVFLALNVVKCPDSGFYLLLLSLGIVVGFAMIKLGLIALRKLV